MRQRAKTSLRLAADIGGTFTDLALLSADGGLFTAKVLSTPDDYARGILEGCRQLFGTTGLDRADVSEVLHASTIATNSILEAKGARTALITTAGFRDVLELRRIRVPRLYEPLYRKPQPLVERRHRYEVRERLAADGAVVVPLDEDEVRRVAMQIADSNIEAVAVCFLHSYINDDHERRAGAILRKCLPGCFITLSVDVLPEIREYERTSTTVINAYVGPPVERYLTSLQDQLGHAGFGAPIRMMQSSGGVLDVRSVIAKPAQVVESGPAAGVIGAAYFGSLCGYDDIITFDMGGTTAKAAVIEKGRHVSTDEYEVGGGISLSSRLVKGGGYALKLPVIDVSEVGAGGGSIVSTDPTGLIKVGPHSAGAMPGPACYGRGGDKPTITDANVVLGYLNPAAIAGGTVPIDAAAAHRALVSLGIDRHVRDVADVIVQLAIATMMRAVKAVTTYRGRDPRDFTLFAFGGAGGLYAAELARSLSMRRVVVPPAAGVFSALGLLFANQEASVSQGFLHRLHAVCVDEVEATFRKLESIAAAQLGATVADVGLRRRMDVRYAGQAFELGIDLAQTPVTHDELAGVASRFDAEHEATYGHRLPPEHPKDVVNLRVVGFRAPDQQRKLDVARLLAAARRIEPGSRPVYFGNAGLLDTPVIGRVDIGATPRCGPMIIEEYEGTTVVPPGTAARLDAAGNIVINLM